MKKFYWLFLLFFVIGTIQLSAQAKISSKINLRDKAQVHRLLTIRGAQFIGRILYFDSNKVRFEISTGSIITYPIEDVKELGLANESRNSFEQEFFTQFPELFISRTAFNPKRKQKHLRSTQVLLNTLDFGATDNYSIGVGYLVPYSIILKSKLTTTRESLFNYGLGLDFVIGLADEDQSRRLLNVYGVTSVGTKRNFFNFSAGVVIPLRSKNRQLDTPIFLSFGGLFSINDYLKVIADIIYLEDGDPKIRPGVGLSWLHGLNRLDIGVFYFSDFIINPVTSPGIGYTWNF